MTSDGITEGDLREMADELREGNILRSPGFAKLGVTVRKERGELVLVPPRCDGYRAALRRIQAFGHDDDPLSAADIAAVALGYEGSADRG